MNNFQTMLLVICVSIIVYVLSNRKIKAFNKRSKIGSSSRPFYYGFCILVWSFAVSIICFVLSSFVETYTTLFALSSKIILVLTFITASIISLLVLKPRFKARQHIEKLVKMLLFLSAVLSISVTIIIILSVLFESIKFFSIIPITNFLFGANWHPQIDLIGAQEHAFGVLPVFAGTLLITSIAMVVAVPFGLLSAIYLSEYSGKKFRTFAKPILEMLAGVPTVVYGYFAAITLGPLIRSFGESLGLHVSTESALSAGLVMGIMIIPFVLSLSDDVMNAVPQNLRDASYALGATKSETIIKVLIPSAFPGIMGGILLAISRAIGETMIVAMAAGMTAKMTINPLDSVTTVTAQIVSLLVGDQEFDNAKTLAAFALALTLFIATLILNIIGLLIVNKYKEQYE